MVLFVTPSLSSLLDEGSSFLQHIFGRVFFTHKVGQDFDLLAAVVDSIPHVPIQYLQAVEAGIPSNHGLGSDGISLLLCESGQTAPDLWSPRQESHVRESMDIQQRSTVSFLYEPPEKWRKWASERFPPLVYTAHSLELPLANTMFHNAQTSTMFAQRWTVTQNREQPEFSRIKQKSLTRQTLNLTKPIGEGEISVHLPLAPITVPRRVTAAMGNIIRRIQTGDTPEDHAPASEEVEKAIHGRFEQVGSPEEREDVWALVTPQNIWVSQPQSTRAKTLFSSIEDGAHLHKVLSGGGGWGAKQGLLSLDPNSTYGRSEQASQLMIEDDGDLEAEKKSVLGELVKPGDVVQFFLYHQKRIKEKQPQDPSKTQVLFNPVHGFRTTIFGTIPSTMDAMLEPPLPTDGEKHGESPHTLIHTHFGALSEQGISLKVTTHNAQDPASSTPVGVRRLGTVVETKFDVPYARFGWVPTEQIFRRQLEHIRALPKAPAGRIRRIVLDENDQDALSNRRVQRWMVPVLPPSGDGSSGGREGEGSLGSARLESFGGNDGGMERRGEVEFGEEGSVGFRTLRHGSAEGEKHQDAGGERKVPVSARMDEIDRLLADPAAVHPSDRGHRGEEDSGSPIPNAENETEAVRFTVRRHKSWGPIPLPEEKERYRDAEAKATRHAEGRGAGKWHVEGESGAEGGPVRRVVTTTPLIREVGWRKKGEDEMSSGGGEGKRESERSRMKGGGEGESGRVGDGWWESMGEFWWGSGSALQSEAGGGESAGESKKGSATASASESASGSGPGSESESVSASESTNSNTPAKEQ